jgi:hypothetical protein
MKAVKDKCGIIYCGSTVFLGEFKLSYSRQKGEKHFLVLMVIIKMLE